MSFYHVETSPKSKKGLFPKILVNDVRHLPIREASSAEQEKISRIVNKVMSLKDCEPLTDTSALEREIDQLVYALYGLTPEEVAIVEGTIS